jgi:predicted SAM-dependent methyltransferase
MSIAWFCLSRAAPALATRLSLFGNRRKLKNCPRWLEIGPGPRVLPGFERYNIVADGLSHYIGDARDLSIFKSGEFALLYASHVLEHIPWYQSLDTLREWRRVLCAGGILEVWVPDALKIATAYVDAATSGGASYCLDGWYRLNDSRDPNLWFSGRMYAYGDGEGALCHPNWHRAAFSEAHLRDLLVRAGFAEVIALGAVDVRGHDHGWINLGVRARKGEEAW